jgi:Ser/Thr protein kinase RdoA (MazF antagonist)
VLTKVGLCVGQQDRVDQVLSALERLRDLFFDIETEEGLTASLIERAHEARMQIDFEIELLRDAAAAAP